jgi:hypothetical protein
VDDETFTNCPECGRGIEPDDSCAVYAVQLRDLGPTFGGPSEAVEGMGAFFHPGCFNRNSRRWRVTDRP